MAKIRMVALDLDGTVLNPDRLITPRVAKAVKDTQARGIVVCLASGRSLCTMRRFRTELGLMGPMVSCNGAYAVDEAGKEIWHHSLDPSSADRLFGYADRKNIHLNVYIRDAINVSGLNGFAQEYLRRTGLQEDEVSVGPYRGDTPTKMLFMDHPECITSYHAELSQELGPDDAAIVLSEADYLEFLPSGISKGRGLAKTAEKLGIGMDEVAAVGDYYNDLEMLELAGIGCAMGSAPDEVKAAADWMAPDNSQEGAAVFLERLIHEGLLA